MRLTSRSLFVAFSYTPVFYWPRIHDSIVVHLHINTKSVFFLVVLSQLLSPADKQTLASKQILQRFSTVNFDIKFVPKWKLICPFFVDLSYSNLTTLSLPGSVRYLLRFSETSFVPCKTLVLRVLIHFLFVSLTLDCLLLFNHLGLFDGLIFLSYFFLTFGNSCTFLSDISVLKFFRSL